MAIFFKEKTSPKNAMLMSKSVKSARLKHGGISFTLYQTCLAFDDKFIKWLKLLSLFYLCYIQLSCYFLSVCVKMLIKKDMNT